MDGSVQEGSKDKKDLPDKEREKLLNFAGVGMGSFDNKYMRGGEPDGPTSSMASKQKAQDIELKNLMG